MDMETLYLGLMMFLTCFILGLGLAILTIPPRLNTLRLWLSPWYGIMGIAIFGLILSMAKLSMQGAYPIIIGTGIILTFYSFITSYTHRPKFKLEKENIYLTGLTIAIFLVSLYPLLGRVAYPTTLSMGNLDPVAYMNVGEYLMDHTVLDGSQMNALSPSTWSIVDLLHYSFRAGPPIILSFFSALLNVKTYEVYSILLALVFALTFPLVYLLGKKMLEKSSLSLMWLVLLFYGLNSTLLYWLTQAFLPQFLYGGLFVSSVLLFLEYSSDKTVNWKLTNFDASIGIIFAAIMTIYPDGLILAFLPIILASVMGYMTKINQGILSKGIKTLGIALLINPIAFATAIQQIMRLVRTTTSTAFIGWEYIRTPAIFEMMGLHNLYYARDLPISVDIILSLPFLYVVLVAVKKLKNKVVILSYMTVMLGFLGFYLLVIDHFFVFHRALGYSLFMWSALFAIGIAQYLESINSRVIVAVIIGVLTLATIRSTIRSLQQYYYHYRVIDYALSDLEKIPLIPEPIYTADVSLGEYDLWKRVWQEHFLRKQNIIDRQNYSLLSPEKRNSTLMLAEKSQVREHPDKFSFTSTIWESEWYILGKMKQIQVSEDLQ